jgi:hypothetical protein
MTQVDHEHGVDAHHRAPSNLLVGNTALLEKLTETAPGDPEDGFACSVRDGDRGERERRLLHRDASPAMVIPNEAVCEPQVRAR